MKSSENTKSSLSIVNSLKSVKRAANQGKKSPHKVLLLLIVLKHYKDFGERWLSFEEHIVPPLIGLLSLAGVSSPRPEYPFWRMKKDGIWVVRIDGHIIENSSGDVSKRELIRLNAKGALSLPIYNMYMNSILEYSTISSLLISNMLDLNPEVESLLRENLNIDIGISSADNLHENIGFEIKSLLDEMMAF